MRNPLVRSPEWINRYYERVSGSTAAAAVGLSPWETRSGLALKMMDPKAREDLSGQPQIRRGVFGEQAALFALQEAAGIDVIPHDQESFVECQKYPHAHCLPDAWANGNHEDGDIVEVKCVGYGVLRRMQECGVPAHYVIQAQHNLAVTGAMVCYFGALHFDSQRLFHEAIHRNESAIAAIMEAEAAFFAQVKAGEIPEDTSALPAEFGQPSQPKRIIDDPKLCDLAATFLADKAQAADLEERIEAAKESLQQALGVMCDEFEFKGVARGTWRSSKPSRSFDHKAAVAEIPALERFYRDNKPARPFIVRPLKGE